MATTPAKSTIPYSATPRREARSQVGRATSQTSVRGSRKGPTRYPPNSAIRVPPCSRQPSLECSM